MRALVIAFALAAVGAPQLEKSAVPGVNHFTKVDATIACAGATTPAGVVEVKKLGYRSIINLRRPTENGADVEAEGTAAKEAGLTYIQLPLNPDDPDPAVADQFLDAVTNPANQPVLIHCATAQRAAAMWMIKRMVVDGWDADKATAEATTIGLTNEKLKAFAIEYAAAHRKRGASRSQVSGLRSQVSSLRSQARA